MKLKRLRSRYIYNILFGVTAAIAYAWPFVDAYAIKKLSPEIHVDPELINGLLAASSIMTGFSIFIASGKIPDKRVSRVLFLILFLQMFTVFVSGSQISEMVMKGESSLGGFLFVSASFSFGIPATSFLVGAKWALMSESETEENH